MIESLRMIECLRIVRSTQSVKGSQVVRITIFVSIETLGSTPVSPHLKHVPLSASLHPHYVHSNFNTPDELSSSACTGTSHPMSVDMDVVHAQFLPLHRSPRFPIPTPKLMM